MPENPSEYIRTRRTELQRRRRMCGIISIQRRVEWCKSAILIIRQHHGFRSQSWSRRHRITAAVCYPPRASFPRPNLECRGRSRWSKGASSRRRKGIKKTEASIGIGMQYVLPSYEINGQDCEQETGGGNHHVTRLPSKDRKVWTGTDFADLGRELRTWQISTRIRRDPCR
jgi:hypothetical protein